MAEIDVERVLKSHYQCDDDSQWCSFCGQECPCDAYQLARALREAREDTRRLDWWLQVLAFHRACGIHVGSTPAEPAPERIKLRFEIIREEYNEMLSARDAGDLVALADGMADVIVTVLGTSIEYGIDLRPIMAEVNRTNLAKAGGPRRADGKILKPDGWEPPRILWCLETQPALDAARRGREEGK